MIPQRTNTNSAQPFSLFFSSLSWFYTLVSTVQPLPSTMKPEPKGQKQFFDQKIH